MTGIPHPPLYLIHPDDKICGRERRSSGDALRVVRIGDRHPQETRTVRLERVHNYFGPTVTPDFVRASARSAQVVIVASLFGYARVIAISLHQGHVPDTVKHNVLVVLVANFHAHFRAFVRKLHV